MFTKNWEDLDLPNPKELAQELGWETGYWAPDPRNQCVLHCFSEGRKSCTIKRAEAEGIFAVSVPGTILCPWDADFASTYYTRNLSMAEGLADLVDQHYESARRVRKLLVENKQGMAGLSGGSKNDVLQR